MAATTTMAVGLPNKQQRQYSPNTKRDLGSGRPMTQLGKLKDATVVLSESTVTKAAQMTTSQVTKAVKDLWEEHKTQRLKLKDLTQQCSEADQKRAQLAHTEEIFLVLASLGEKLLGLGVFDSDVYPNALADTITSLAPTGLDCLSECYEKIDAEVKFPVTAAMVFCAFFYPMHLYRGYGAALLENWEWGCPDLESLEKEKIKEQGSWLTRLGKEKPVVQANQQVLEAFDRALLSLQGKSKSKDFLARKPPISGLVASHPRYGKKEKKDFKKDLDLLEDFTKEVNKRGHPSPANEATTSWAIPFATWRSKFSCTMVKSWDDVLAFQMDPGRLLHAYLHRNVLSLTPGHMVVLPPGTLGEALACWLEGLPGTDHRILRWAGLDTEAFNKKMRKADKNVWRKLGQYPLPNTFVMKGTPVPSRPDSAVAATPVARPIQSTQEPVAVATPPPQPVQSAIETNGAESERPLSSADPGEAAPPPYASAEAQEERPVAFSPDEIGTKDRSPSASSLTQVGDSKPSTSSFSSESTPDRDHKPSISSISSADSRLATMRSSPNLSIKRKPAPARQNSESGRFSPISSVSEEPSVADGMRYDTVASPTTTAAVSESYLDLLNEVANGTISPLQLQQILHHRQASDSMAGSYFTDLGMTKSLGSPPPEDKRVSVLNPAVLASPQPVFEMDSNPVEKDSTPVEKDSRELSVPWGINDGSYLPAGGAIVELPTERDPIETDGTPVLTSVALATKDTTDSSETVRTNTTIPVAFRASGKEAILPDDGKEAVSPPTIVPAVNDATTKMNNAIDDAHSSDKFPTRTAENVTGKTVPQQQKEAESNGNGDEGTGKSADAQNQESPEADLRFDGPKYPRTGIVGVQVPESLRPQRPLPYPI